MSEDLAEQARRAAHRLPRAIQALDDALGVIPASTGGTGAVSGVSDRTGRLACSYIENPKQADPARHDLDRLTDVLWAIRTHAARRAHFIDFVAIVDRWAPDPKRKQVLEDGLRAAANDDLNYRGDINNCRSCARIPGQWGDPHRQGMCKRCDHTLARITELYHHDYDMPPRELLARCQGRRITNGDIANAMHGHRRRT